MKELLKNIFTRQPKVNRELMAHIIWNSEVEKKKREEYKKQLSAKLNKIIWDSPHNIKKIMEHWDNSNDSTIINPQAKIRELKADIIVFNEESDKLELALLLEKQRWMIENK